MMKRLKDLKMVLNNSVFIVLIIIYLCLACGTKTEYIKPNLPEIHKGIKEKKVEIRSCNENLNNLIDRPVIMNSLFVKFAQCVYLQQKDFLFNNCVYESFFEGYKSIEQSCKEQFK